MPGDYRFRGRLGGREKGKGNKQMMKSKQSYYEVVTVTDRDRHGRLAEWYTPGERFGTLPEAKAYGKQIAAQYEASEFALIRVEITEIKGYNLKDAKV